MRARRRDVGLLLALPILLAGCGVADATTPTAQSSSQSPSATPSSGQPGEAMTPGMVMPDGSTMTGRAAPSSAAGRPSKAAQMICEPEIQDSVKTIAGLAAPPATTTTWADQLFTCTYQMPTGSLVISVNEAADEASGHAYFTSLQKRLEHTKTLPGVLGLGLPAFETADGSAVFLKDGMTLRVDASTLPATVGPEHTARGDFAYTIASNILGCWSGDS